MRNTAVFGKRREPHTVIIARGDEIRHFTVRPWMAALVGSAIAAVAIGYLMATTYLVLRDDLIGASVAHQARLQQAYEDRIAALRAQVDRITSRQMLDQQLMERKVTELLSRQEQLSARHTRLGPALDAHGAPDALPATAAPVPTLRPDRRADSDQNSPTLAAAASSPLFLRGAHIGENAADRADRVFVAINRSLRDIESEQMERIRNLTQGAHETADQIATALRSSGLGFDIDGDDAAGGPLLPADPSASFEDEVQELDDALSRLDTVKTQVRRLPLANPAPGHSISSRFGVRRDPLLGIRAMHAGLDFRAVRGTDIKVTAAGTVVHAGWSGGYGRMVEVEHEDGFVTRYAHMSKILVAKGDPLKPGDIVGRVGSSGRSTGPHLHYEVRRGGKPLDPIKFIKAGETLEQFL